MVLAEKFGRILLEAKNGETQNERRVDKKQYFMKDLFLITDIEPCFMCAMGLVHSRIARLYF